MRQFAAELENNIHIYRRDHLKLVSNFILLVIMFWGIFLGGMLVSNSILGSNSLTSLVIGYSLWVLIMTTISNMGQTIFSEAENGTIEQLFLVPKGASKLFFIKEIVNLIISFAYSTIVLILLMLTTNRWIKFPLTVILPYFLALISLMGVGYIVLAITLRYKRIGSTLEVGQYIYLGLILFDFYNGDVWLKEIGNTIPLYPMIYWIKEIVNGEVKDQMNLISISIINAFAWLLLGIVIFKLTVRKIKQDGTLNKF